MRINRPETRFLRINLARTVPLNQRICRNRDIWRKFCFQINREVRMQENVLCEDTAPAFSRSKKVST